jgi:hypothetical protein
MRRLGLTWADGLAVEQGLRHQQVLFAVQAQGERAIRQVRSAMVQFGGRPIGPSRAASVQPSPG